MIKDIPYGKLVPSIPEERNWVSFDYSHLLPPNLKKYRIQVKSNFWGKDTLVIAKVWVGNKTAARVSAHCSPNKHIADIGYAETQLKYRGKGLGFYAYEALFAHLYHKFNVRTVRGGSHSSSAARTHQKIAQKHGLKYPFVNIDIPKGSDFDEVYDSYRYRLE